MGKKSQPPDASVIRAEMAASQAGSNPAIIEAVRVDLIPYVNQRLGSPTKPKRDQEPLGVTVSGWAGQCHLQHRFNPRSPLLVGFELIRECYEGAGYTVMLSSRSDRHNPTFRDSYDLVAYVNQVRGEQVIVVSIIAR
jgi:hypothetical protein